MKYRTLAALTSGLLAAAMPVLAQDVAPVSPPATVAAPVPAEAVAAEASATVPTGLSVDVKLAKDVVDREPVEVGETFSVSVGQVVGWTLVHGATEPTTIRHIWSFDGNEVATVTIEVKSARYRTWSRKKIGDRVGSWSFVVTDANGNTLASKAFEVTAATTPQ